MPVEKFDCFDVSIENNIAHICLNRPEKRNSMIPAFWDQLPKAIADIDDNARARVIVISSTGPVFSAGMDLAAFAPKAPVDKDEARRVDEQDQALREHERHEQLAPSVQADESGKRDQAADP